VATLDSEEKRQKTIDVEIEKYLEWIRTLEKKACEKKVLPNASEWFHGEILSAYTRSSNSASSLAGKRTIVFSNIELQEDYRGQGFLHQLLQRIDQEAGQFAATHVMFESIINPDLVKYLEKIGFKPATQFESAAPSMTKELGLKLAVKISP
jgi:GNAT superfamily N-acetyltransferase